VDRLVKAALNPSSACTQCCSYRAHGLAQAQLSHFGSKMGQLKSPVV
jgi:hypothetical protein